MTFRRLLVVFLSLALIAAACSRDEDDPGATDDDGGPGAGQEEGTSAYDDPGFGNIEEVCSEGDGGGDTAQRAQADEAETQGVTEDSINIGTVADPGFEGRQGLNQELFDASEAFVEWCNSHGGINGREINLTLYGAAISDYQPQMETACGNEFVMVGSGAVQDSLWPETGAACGLVEISTFAVTPEHAGVSGTPEETAATRTVQPVPNPSDLFQVTSGEIVAEEFPEAVEERGHPLRRPRDPDRPAGPQRRGLGAGRVELRPRRHLQHPGRGQLGPVRHRAPGQWGRGAHLRGRGAELRSPAAGHAGGGLRARGDGGRDQPL